MDDEAAMLRQARQQLEAKRAGFESEVKAKWGDSSGGQDRIRVNVGGEIFEATRETLCMDRFSLLAALCADVYPKLGDQPAASGGSASAAEDGAGDGKGAARSEQSSAQTSIPFIDRDWWLFRHILAFLQGGDSALPDDVELLRQLYLETAYFRLNSMRVAIETKVRDRALPPSVLAPQLPGAPSLDDEDLLRRWGRIGGSRGPPPKGAEAAQKAQETEAAAQQALKWAQYTRQVSGLALDGEDEEAAAAADDWMDQRDLLVATVQEAAGGGPSGRDAIAESLLGSRGAAARLAAHELEGLSGAGPGPAELLAQMLAPGAEGPAGPSGADTAALAEVMERRRALRRRFRRDRSLGGLALEASEGATHEGDEPWGVLEQGRAMARGYLRQGMGAGLGGPDEFGLAPGGIGAGGGSGFGAAGGRIGGGGRWGPSLDEEGNSVPLEVRAAATRLPDPFGLHPGRERKSQELLGRFGST